MSSLVVGYCYTVLHDFSLRAIGVSKLYTFMYTAILSVDWLPEKFISVSLVGSTGRGFLVRGSFNTICFWLIGFLHTTMSRTLPASEMRGIAVLHPCSRNLFLFICGDIK